MVKEKYIQKTIKEYLEYSGWLVWKHNSVGIYKKDTGTYIPVGVKGICDLFALKNGRLLGIEVKTEKGIQSDNQKEWEKVFAAHGGEYILARSIDDVSPFLDKIKV